MEDAIAAEAAAQERVRRRNRRRALIGSLLLVVAMVGAGGLFYRWTQAHYYVTTLNGQVVIYQGIPQSLGPVEFSHVVQTYDEPAVEALSPRMRELLKDNVHRDSLRAAREYVEVTVASHVEPSEPSTSPSAGGSPTAAPSPSTAGPSASPPSPTPSTGSTQGG